MTRSSIRVLPIRLREASRRTRHVGAGGEHGDASSRALRACTPVARAREHRRVGSRTRARSRSRPIAKLAARRLCFVALLALIAIGCRRTAPVSDESGGAALMRNLLRAPGVDVEVDAGAGDRSSLDALSRAALRAEARLGVPYHVIRSAADGDGRRARIFVGTLASERARTLADKLGLSIGDNERGAFFRARDQTFDDPRDGLIATFEDPERRGLPITLILANDAHALAGYAGELDAGWLPWVRMFSAGELFFSGPLRHGGEVIAARLDRPVERRRGELAGFVELPRNDLGITGESSILIPREEVASYMAFAAQARARVEAWVKPTAPCPPISLFLYARVEDLAASTDSGTLSSWNPVGNFVHALCAQNLPHDGGAAVAHASAVGWLGAPADPWLADGAATDAAQVWWNHYLERWVAWLHSGHLVPRLSEIVDPRATERLSPHIVVPLRAELFRFLLDTRGAVFVRELWSGAGHLSIDADLERAFDAHWTEIDARQRDVVDRRRRARDEAARTATMLKGVVLDAASRDPERALGSQLCDRSLRELAAFGANAVAVTAYAVDAHEPPRLVGIGQSHDLGLLDGDLALYAALTDAKFRKLATLFSPHLLTARGGSWQGAWVRATPEAWAEFFADYERFAVHCALLCELANVDVMSLGSEITDVTRGATEGRRARAEEVEEKRAGWSRVIAAVRGAFGGRITYGASSASDAERVAFWPELDAVGFEIGYPQSAHYRDASPNGRTFLLTTMINDLAAAERVAEAAQKPLFLTQVAINAGTGGVRLTRFGPGSTDIDVQSDAFALLESVLVPAAQRGRLQAVFVSRWSSDPNDRGFDAGDFIFEHRPAAAVVGRMFGEL